MKNIISTALLGLIILASCNKETAIKPIPDPKLKSISYSFDTFYLFCNACPPDISQKAEHFMYDDLDRVTQRILTISRVYPNDSIKVDTSEIFSYAYLGNSNSITSYTHASSEGIAHHILTYDAQNRLIRDSITNPQVGNDKLTLFTYLNNTIIEKERQTFIVGVENRTDTMFISGNNIIEEKTTGFPTMHFVYTVSKYRNPLSYVNNFSLHASDYKNGSASTIFKFYTPQYVTYNLTTKILLNASTPETTLFAVTIDSLNRVKSFSNSSNRNKVTTFEYY